MISSASTGRGDHERLYRQAARLLPLVAVFIVADDLLLRPRHRRPGDPVGRARRESGRHRRDPPPVRPRPAALGTIWAVHVQPAQRRPRPVVLLPDAGLRAVSRALAEFPDAGAGRDDLLAAD